MTLVGATVNVGGATKVVTSTVAVDVEKIATATVHVPVSRDPTTYSALIFIIDDVGKERFALYEKGAGQGYAKTPRFDAWAAEGVLFTRAYAQPVCGPTRAATNTGRLAHRTGFGSNIGGVNNQPLDTAERILAELVRDGRGQQTYARGYFGKYHLAPATGYEQHMTSQGVQRYGGTMGNIGANPGIGSIDHFHWRHTISTFSSTNTLLVNAPPFDETTYSSSVFRADFAAWITGVTKPFVAVVALNAPHEPFTCPPETCVSPETWTALQAAGINAGDNLDPDVDDPDDVQLVYDAATEATDTEFGRCWDALSPAQQATTLLMVSGDNGSPANIIRTPYDPTHAKATPYEQGVWVPMVVRGPPSLVTSPGRTCDRLVHTLDFWATVADTLDIPEAFRAPGITIDSRSLMPLLRGEDAEIRSDFLFHTFTPNGPSGTVRSKDLRGLLTVDGWKYIYLFANDFAQERLHYLPDDPLEIEDLLIDPTPEATAKAAELRARVDVILGGWS